MIVFRVYMLIGVYPLVASIRYMIDVNKFCDLTSEESTKRCYIKETLATLAHSPNQLAVSKASNTLYFSFDAGQGEYLPAILNIDTKKLTVIKGVKDAFAMAVDSKEEIYFGGSHGIYKYNRPLRSLKRLNVTNLDVWWLQIKSRLYFIKFPSLKAYYYENKIVQPVLELQNTTVNQFVFDADNNTFFINGSGLFGIKRGQGDAILLKDTPRFFGMAVDNFGYVHLCSETGIFVISKMVQKVKRLVRVNGVLGLAFDKNNNIIYSDSHDIFRLKPVSSEEYYNIANNSLQ